MAQSGVVQSHCFRSNCCMAAIQGPFCRNKLENLKMHHQAERKGARETDRETERLPLCFINQVFGQDRQTVRTGQW